MCDKCGPDRALPKLAFPDCSVETDASRVGILIDDQRVLEPVVDDLSSRLSVSRDGARQSVTMDETRDIRLEQALFSLQLVLAGVDLDCQGVAGLESNKGAVEQNHLYEPGCRPC